MARLSSQQPTQTCVTAPTAKGHGRVLPRVFWDLSAISTTRHVRRERMRRIVILASILQRWVGTLGRGRQRHKIFGNILHRVGAVAEGGAHGHGAIGSLARQRSGICGRAVQRGKRGRQRGLAFRLAPARGRAALGLAPGLGVTLASNGRRLRNPCDGRHLVVPYGESDDMPVLLRHRIQPPVALERLPIGLSRAGFLLQDEFVLDGLSGRKLDLRAGPNWELLSARGHLHGVGGAPIAQCGAAPDDEQSFATLRLAALNLEHDRGHGGLERRSLRWRAPHGRLRR
mmetsp:Transcript_13114/g.39095  ORF Transcript_13114/g.39095 Transcript_13114/m.39095 type:complete len:286 (+) Transcript_13114:181-1038(+)